VTELGPATAFAYEPAESLLMQQPPRDAKRGRLASAPLLFYSYGQAGIVLLSATFLVYFFVFGAYGVSVNDILTMNNRYFPVPKDVDPTSNAAIFNTSDGSGRSYTPEEQTQILGIVQASWFLTIVCGQVTCKMYAQQPFCLFVVF
jgi:magnesium-transporting ATPase (P-type)